MDLSHCHVSLEALFGRCACVDSKVTRSAHLPASPCCNVPFLKPALLVGEGMHVLAAPCCTEAAAGRKHYESQSLSRVSLACLSGTPEREARR